MPKSLLELTSIPRDADSLDRTKRGIWVYYSVKTRPLADLATLIGGGL
ncbi:MAG: hypothetical protein ACRCTR_01190 [Actinomycetota bacterium]